LAKTHFYCIFDFFGVARARARKRARVRYINARIIERHGKSWEIGETRLNRLLFQDDIFTSNKTEGIQEAVKIIETFQNPKRLQFYMDKTKKSVISSKSEESVYINESEIDLGKIIEEKENHKEYIKEIMKKGNVVAIISTAIVNENNLSSKRIEVGL